MMKDSAPTLQETRAKAGAIELARYTGNCITWPDWAAQ